MIQTILRGYKNLLLLAVKIILLFAACLLAGLAVVWPLWYFSHTAPHLYTLFVITAAAAFVIFRIVRMLSQLPVKKIVSLFLQLIIIASGLFFCVYFILIGRRLAALGVFILAFILFGISRFDMRTK